MKRLVTSDLHFGLKKNDLRYNEMQMRWAKEFVVDLCHEHGIEHIDILGDVFHHKELTDGQIKSNLLSLLKNEWKDFKVTMIVGNHDTYYRTKNDVHNLEFLEDLPNVTIHTEYAVETLPNGKKIGWCPWVYEDGDTKFSEAMKAGGRVDCLYGHFECKGFKYNRHMDSTHGDDPHVYLSNKPDIVFSGHYHTSSITNIEDTTWIYTGTPWPQTRIDEGDPKGVWIYDTDKPRHDCYEFVLSKGVTQYVTHSIADIDSLSDDDIRYNCITIMVPRSGVKDFDADEVVMSLVSRGALSVDVRYVEDVEKFIDRVRSVKREDVEDSLPEAIRGDDGDGSALGLSLRYLKATNYDRYEKAVGFLTEAFEAVTNK